MKRKSSEFDYLKKNVELKVLKTEYRAALFSAIIATTLAPAMLVFYLLSPPSARRSNPWWVFIIISIAAAIYAFWYFSEYRDAKKKWNFRNNRLRGIGRPRPLNPSPPKRSRVEQIMTENDEDYLFEGYDTTDITKYKVMVIDITQEAKNIGARAKAPFIIRECGHEHHTLDDAAKCLFDLKGRNLAASSNERLKRIEEWGSAQIRHNDGTPLELHEDDEIFLKYGYDLY